MQNERLEDEKILTLKRQLEDKETAMRMSFVNMLKEIDFDKIEANIKTEEQRKIFDEQKIKIETIKKRYL